MKMQYALITFCLFLSNISVAQGLEEIRERMASETERQKIESCLDISESDVPKDTIFFYLDKALEISRSIQFDSLFPIYYNLSVQRYFSGEFIRAKQEIRKGFTILEHTDYPNARKGHIYMFLGVFSEANGENDSALYFYDRALNVLHGDTTLKARELIVNTYTNRANIDLKQGDYSKAIEVYLDAAVDSREIGDTKNYAISLNSAAGCYKNLGNYFQSLEYYKKSLTIARDIENKKLIAGALTGMGEIYAIQKKYDLGIDTLLKAEKLLVEEGIKHVLHIAYQGLGTCYLGLGDFEKAEQYSNKAMQGVQEVQDDFSKVSMYLLEHNILREKGEYNEAFKYLTSAHKLAVENKYVDLQKNCVEAKIAMHKIFGNNKGQIDLYETLLILNDSIINKEKARTIEHAQVKYKTLETKNELVEEKLKLEQTERENESVKNKYYLAIASLLILGLIALTIILFKRNKDRKNNLKKEQELESINLELLHKTLDPHYVNGVLNSIGSVIYDESPKSYDYLLKFAHQIKSTFANKSNITTIKTQINEAENYLEIVKLRHQDAFDYTFSNTIDNIDIYLPKLLLQNLVHNAVSHGVSESQDILVITIKVRQDSQNIILEVEDNGDGLKMENTSQKQGTKTAIETYKKIFELFNTINGSNAHIELIDKKDISPKAHGVISRVTIPKQYTFTIQS